jgi:hypothetical protein
MHTTFKKPEIKYGLIIGIGVSLFVLIEYLLGFHTKYLNIGRYTGYASTIIPIVGLYYAIRAKRLENPDKTITFKSAFITGLIASAIASVLISGFFFLYNTQINPGWINKALEADKKQLIKEGVKEKELESSMKLRTELYSPQTQLTSVLFGTLINGAILTLIIAAIAARKAKTPPVKNENHNL